MKLYQCGKMVGHCMPCSTISFDSLSTISVDKEWIHEIVERSVPVKATVICKNKEKDPSMKWKSIGQYERKIKFENVFCSVSWPSNERP